ncbi:hypothetical protein F511_18133 [Dorcoceras hygrometricum]|uniref:Uncharacterized protein n=1 Tax=Dorcoceras hygrometricum TaxID=472368 RepID=A0A2Z7CBC5_9LAMI|nr:hypothetical protein F511_18133 [Dorcoceras hygrometricum]
MVRISLEPYQKSSSLSFFSKNGEQVENHGKKKPMKYEFRLLNDILAKAVTVKVGSFDAVTVERFQMMTAIHYGLKVNWGKVLFNVLKDMVDQSQRKEKGFAAQIDVLLKGMTTITMGNGVSFPSAKILSMKTVNTYIATNTTIDAREEQGMVSEATVKRTPKSKKKSSSADDTPVKIISEIAGSKKRVATEDNAPAIPKKRRTVKTKPSFSPASLDIVNVAQDVVPIQVIDPTPAEIVKDADAVAVTSTDEADIIIAKVLEDTLENSEPEFVDKMIDTRAESSISPVVDKEMNKFVDREQVTEETMSIDDILLQGTPWTATASQIFDLLSDAHSKSLEDILAQQREHGLPLAQPCPSPIVDSSVDSGAVLARFYSIENSTCWRASGDLQEVDITGDEEVDLVSSDVSTVYRSPSPIFQESPASSPATYQPQESSSSSTDVSVHFDSTDVPLNAQEDTQASAPVDFTMFTDALEDLRSSIFQRIHDSNCEILSKVNAVELGVRGDLLKLQVLLRQSLENACRFLERQGTTQATQINDLKKGLMAPVGTIFEDLFDIKKKQREQDAKIIALGGFDDVSHSRISDIMTSPSYLATMFPTDMMTSAVLKFVNGRYDDVSSAEICKWFNCVYRDRYLNKGLLASNLQVIPSEAEEGET